MAAERCQRIGCNATFTAEDNPENSCRYHPGPPLFHDGGKEWKCCKQRSHDFSLFMDIPGCKTGRHTSEKLQTTFASSTRISTSTPIGVKNPTTLTRDICPRCKQGFFCSDHGSQPVLRSSTQSNSVVANTDTLKTNSEENMKCDEKPRHFDFKAEQTCKNCKNTFTEMGNHETACEYHPGPPVFHDRSRGWSCCNVHVKEFDEFLAIPPCKKGWHQG